MKFALPDREGRFPRTRATFFLLYDAAQAWINDRALRLGAGVAYYALFALVPVMFLSIAFASFFLGQAVRTDIEQAIAEFIGEEAAVAFVSLIDNIDLGGSSAIISLVSLGILLFTATLLFVSWKEVTDLMWDLPRRRGVKASIARRLFGLTAVLGAGVLLTLNIAIGTIIAFVDQFLSSPLLDALLKLSGSIAVVLLGAIFVGVLFKYTPNEQVSYRSVWFASVISMSMLVLGAWGYGIYVDRYGLSSAAGAAGAVFLGLVFVYYATAILLYGMEIVRFSHYGDGYVPLAFKRFRPEWGRRDS